MTPLRCLLSYAFFKNVDLAELEAELRTSYGGPVEIFADSGAFSVATTGATVKLKEYAAWLGEWSPALTTAATLDVIGDPDATARNTETLLDAGLKVLPTFHVGTPWPELEKLCARYPYLALGGMVPFNKHGDQVLRWLIRCFRVAQEHGTVFHGFGQTRISTVSALPFYSVDSSAWARGLRYGLFTLWDDQRARRVLLYSGHPVDARRHAGLLRAHGADPALVGRPGFARREERRAGDYERERDMLQGAPVVAYHRLGRWLERRHSVPAPAGLKAPGTGLFLACGDEGQARLAARVLGGAA